MALPEPTYILTGSDGRPYESQVPGSFGGYRSSRVYGRLDCPSAQRALAHGGYVPQRVFFADEQAAIDAGYRPCATCLPEQYARWKRARQEPVSGQPAARTAARAGW
jgi:methylphosphotriester-DNA--protein-cysteine methyltransferase